MQNPIKSKRLVSEIVLPKTLEPTGILKKRKFMRALGTLPCAHKKIGELAPDHQAAGPPQ